jgi:hypothetical protein
MTTKIIGHIGVDAGLCWIGDPSYILPDGAGENPGVDWGKFCDVLGDDWPVAKSFAYKKGHEGLGVCVNTGYGDGFYPVEADIEGGRIKSVTVTFIEDEENE